MTPSELKHHVDQINPLFFSRESMKFAGDTMRNYGVRRVAVLADFDERGVYCPGIKRGVWELYRKRATAHGFTASAYFDVDTFKRVHVLTP